MSKTALFIVAFAALGGILYGFDIGVISGALVFMQRDLAITEVHASLVIAAVLGGGALATLFSGPVADWWGRRSSIALSALVFVVGTLVLMVASDYAMVMAGRLVQGVGVGIMIIVIPLYLAETTPALWRGRGVLAFHLCVTLGILLGYVVNNAFEASGDWRRMFATALLPAVLLLVGSLLVLPGSPRWLYARGRIDQARKALARIQQGAGVELALAEMQAVVARERRQAGSSWGMLLRPGYRRAFLLALAIGILNQLTGINVLLQFNAKILGASGFQTAIVESLVVGGVNVVVTIVGMLLIDRVGRRPLLIFGAAGVTAALVWMGLVHVVPLPAAFVDQATLWGLLAFIACFAIGPGVVALLTISEILPLAIRAKGMAVALFANSLASAALAAIFMSGVAAIGYGGMFLVLAGFTALYVLLAIFPMPEAKGRSLEDIENQFLDTRS